VVDAGEDGTSVIFRGGGAAVVVEAPGISDTVDSSLATFRVVVLQSVAAEEGADGAGEVGATWIGDVVVSRTAVVEGLGSVGVVCTIFSVAAGVVVVSGPV